MPPMEVDIEEVDKLLVERQEAERELDEYITQLSLPTLKIVYEDLLVERDETIEQVLGFLGVRPHPLSETTMKHTSDDLRDVVENFDVLDRHFSGTVYQSMLKERILLNG
jgi:hypothetical protein